MSNLSDGLIILAMGLGFVLCFLVILIIAMFVMSKVVCYLNKLFPEAVEEVKAVAKKAAASVDEAVALAIAVAMAKRRG